MACCAPEQTNYDKQLLKKLRSIGKPINMMVKENKKNKKSIGEPIYMKLLSDVKENKKNKKLECKFNGKNWTGNIDDIYGSANYINEEEEENIKNLKQKINERELEIDALEKEYLAKTVRLLYMVQTHCQIKVENDGLFEPIKTGNFLPDIKDLPTLIDDNKDKVKKKLENPIPA